MEEAQWERWAKGVACPFDAPRPESNSHWDLIAALAVSSLYLSSNQTYHGHCLLIFDPRHVTRPDQLSPQEWTAFCADLYGAEKALMGVLRPDHINVEILGNVVPHLHWQIVPRYRNDPRWGAPVWTATIAEMPVTAMGVGERAELIQEIRSAIADSL